MSAIMRRRNSVMASLPWQEKWKASSNRKPIPARLSSGPQQRAENEKGSPTSRAMLSIKRETTAGTHNADCHGKTPHYRAAISSNVRFLKTPLKQPRSRYQASFQSEIGISVFKPPES